MYDDERGRNQQRDLVLANNEFCFVQSQTNGSIRTHVGPTTVSISQQESLVLFDKTTKRFRQVDHSHAKQLFVTAPEGWYVTLKNPTTDGQFPQSGASNISPDTIKVGVKINIAGPVSFALYPGQMAKVVQGHKLHSNQYLLAHVYDAGALEESETKTTAMVDSDGNEVAEHTSEKYSTGQLLVIKGTEAAFYMPPTGIEIVSDEHGNYVREAVTLERLNYAILKNEDGQKRYVHGPAVVFPEPTETFIMNTDNSPIFRALELSPISGIYVKVIASYEQNGVRHEPGEELFITGDDDGQKIYYPRPEHAIISYGDRIMHYAIAIPAGEGRYVLNRMTGGVETVKGPSMFLPDPRTQVIVRRILTDKECQLLYPGNKGVEEYNCQLRKGSAADYADTTLATKVTASVLPVAQADIRRSTTFTKPRTITLDTKFDGVVSVDVWTGYAINVVSRTGKRQVVVGPTTRLLDYDETVEALQLSTGKPKTTDQLETVAFLRIDNNKISDIIEAQTKDFVSVKIKVSYVVDFLREYQDRWFSVENYVKFLCDRERTAVKKAVKNYTIQELHERTIEIVMDAVLRTNLMSGTDETHGSSETLEVEAEVSEVAVDDVEVAEVTSEVAEITEVPHGYLFTENGMFVKDVEVLELDMDQEIKQLMTAHQKSIVRDSLNLASAEGHLALQKQLSQTKMEEESLNNQVQMLQLSLQNAYDQGCIRVERERAELEERAALAAAKAKEVLQSTLDAIHQAELAREDATYNQDAQHRDMDAEIEQKRQANYAATIETIFGAISPDLVAALTAKANAKILTEATRAMAPWAIAQDESIPETVNKLLRGTTLEGVLESINMQVED